MGCSIMSYMPPPRMNMEIPTSKNAIREVEGLNEIDGKRNSLIFFIRLDKI